MDYCTETATLYTKKGAFASKDLRCDACRETIPKHHRYMRVGILFDGSWETVVRCLRCDAVHVHLVELHYQRRRSGWEDEWPSDRLDCGHEYKEVHGQAPPDEIAALAFALPGEGPV